MSIINAIKCKAVKRRWRVRHLSEVFMGLWLDPAALVRDDPATVLAAVQQGLSSPEHAAFVARLHQPPP